MFGAGILELIVVAVIACCVPALVLVGLVWLLLKALNGGSRKSRDADAEETRIIQEIYSGMARLERRVESLETILLDSTGAELGK